MKRIALATSAFALSTTMASAGARLPAMAMVVLSAKALVASAILFMVFSISGIRKKRITDVHIYIISSAQTFLFFAFRLKAMPGDGGATAT